jgi:histidinol-phosphate/aromatic aminotransferase/cobyric acid decarboxylase-like protein
MPAFVITRIQTGDYETWRPMFDQDRPRAREKASAQRLFRDVDDPNHVFVFLEFDSLDDANEARERLVASGVLDRFEDKHGPNVLQET